MIKRTQLVLTVFLALVLLSACGGETPGTGVFVWIDVPVNGLTIPLGQPIHVEGHATSPTGIERVEIWVNDTLTTTISSLSVEGELAHFYYDWTPAEEGEYVIQALSFSSSGEASAADTTRVIVGGISSSNPDLAIISVEALVAGDKDGVPFCNTRVVYSNAGSAAIPSDFSIQFSFDGIPQETVTVAGGLAPGTSTEAIFVYQFTDLHYIGVNLDSGNVIAEIDEGNNAFAEARMCAATGTEPTLVPTETLVPVPGAVIQFWADPPEIQAGACTTIKWHVESVSKVVFGGIEQPFDGSYQDCLCADQRYTLTVTHLDNTEEKRTVDIAVAGSCVTLTSPPPQDTTPPLAPTLAVPDNGLSLSCRASQNLAWLPVDDPSGIAEYQVQVQRHSGDNNWQDVSGSVFRGISDKQIGINVECGWYYRWRVQAVDGAGNVGPWSGWWQFAITLS